MTTATFVFDLLPQLIPVGIPRIPLLPPRSAAAEAHDECGEEEDDCRRKCEPDGIAKA